MEIRSLIGETMRTYLRCWHTLVARAFAVYVGLAFAEGAIERFLYGPWILLYPLLLLVGYAWLIGRHLLECAAAFRHEDEPDLHVGVLTVLRLAVVSLVYVALLMLTIPGAVALTWLSMVVPVMVVERCGFFSSIRRSWRLVRGHALKVFATLAIGTALTGVATTALFLLVAMVYNDSPTAAAFATTAGVEPLTAPLLILVVAAVYLRLRAIAGGEELKPLQIAVPAGRLAPAAAGG